MFLFYINMDVEFLKKKKKIILAKISDINLTTTIAMCHDSWMMLTRMCIHALQLYVHTGCASDLCLWCILSA